jgi:hypothetical protein
MFLYLPHIQCAPFRNPPSPKRAAVSLNYRVVHDGRCMGIVRLCCVVAVPSQAMAWAEFNILKVEDMKVHH